MRLLPAVFFVLASIALQVSAAEKGMTIVVKKDERRIAGLNTNGITGGRRVWVRTVMR